MPGALWTWKARRRGVVSSDGWVDAVIIEVGGRWFLTDTFVDNPGEELDRSADPSVIGRAVRRWLKHRVQRPGLATPHPSPDAWEAFCEQVMGVEPEELQPERSLIVAVRGQSFLCRDELGGDGAVLEVRNDDASVGALVVEQLGRLPVRSPIVARALVARIDGGWRAMAAPSLRWTSHVHAADPGGLADAIAAALDASAALKASGIGPKDRFDQSEQVLREATWEQVARRADGGLVLFDDDGLLDVTAEDVEATVSTRLVDAAVAPTPPPAGMPTWLGASEVARDDVVAALGLVDTLPIGADDGIAWAAGEGVVVLPPIDGWTLVLGQGLDATALARRLDTVVEAREVDPLLLPPLADLEATWGRLP